MTLNLTRSQTAFIEQYRNLDAWRVLSDLLPENNECADELYLSIDDRYQELEDDIDTAGEATGINENNEEYTIIPYTNRKPPITRPTWPF